MTPFDFQPRTRIVFGPGKVEALGDLARQLGAKRALVVSDPGIVAVGHTEKGIASLRQAGIESRIFSEIHENPSTDDVDAGVAVAKEYRPDLLIGLGGGSSMDCAKGINFLLTGGGKMSDYWGVGKARGDMLPMIAVPTTSGTGSEMQSFALISDAQTHVKMACGDRRAACRVALLDPQLTVTQPARITALTGIDAISHAVETFVTKTRNPASLAFSREAWLLLSENFARAIDEPTNLEARSGMQLGASFAGLAIENSMLGIAHSLANPLTARFEVPHGQAIAAMLPHVVRFNGQQFDTWYRDLLEVSIGHTAAPPPESGAAGLAEFLTSLVTKAGLSTQLSQLGVPNNSLDTLAEEAAKQWTATFNPRAVTTADLAGLYRQAY